MAGNKAGCRQLNGLKYWLIRNEELGICKLIYKKRKSSRNTLVRINGENGVL
jgi:hypothetical protein